MKKFLILFLSNFIFAQGNNEKYIINGEIEGDYNGYIYLNFDTKKDSCLVVNKKFYFEGKTSDEIVFEGRFGTNFTSGMHNDFYIENKNITILLSIERKKYNTTSYDYITIKNIEGTTTSMIQKDFNAFKKNNSIHWDTVKYDKIEEIVSKHPKNQYSGSILYGTTFDSIFDKERVLKILTKIDTTAQNPLLMINLKETLFPKSKQLLNSLLVDFELPNQNNKYLNTIKYRGNLLLIDFWASWCAPCREKIPFLKKINEKYRDKKFKILSVSLDNEKGKWKKALLKEKMNWDQVIDVADFKGLAAQKFHIKAIPFLMLIDENGKIIGVNPSEEELITILNEQLN